MVGAVKVVHEVGMPYREAARNFNIPVETLRRRVIGNGRKIRPFYSTYKGGGGSTCQVCHRYMADMGFGLLRKDIMRMAFVIAERMGKSHPFKDKSAGRGWYEGFRSRRPYLTLRSPQPLSYSRALCTRKTMMDEVFLLN